LGGTVGELQARMTQAEFEGWQEFYVRYPFDDFHRFHRPAALVASSFGGKLPDMLEWLAPDRGGDAMTDAEQGWMRALGLDRKGG
jgi:hypothetical protein